MGRPKYRIKQSDIAKASSWIFNHVTWIADPGTGDFVIARKELDTADLEDTDLKRCEALNEWCEKWMKRKHWERMKNTVRATRKRGKDKYGATGMTTISVTKHASLLIKTAAKTNGVSVSSIIMRKFGKKGPV